MASSPTYEPHLRIAATFATLVAALLPAGGVAMRLVAFLASPSAALRSQALQLAPAVPLGNLALLGLFGSLLPAVFTAGLIVGLHWWATPVPPARAPALFRKSRLSKSRLSTIVVLIAMPTCAGVLLPGWPGAGLLFLATFTSTIAYVFLVDRRKRTTVTAAIPAIAIVLLGGPAALGVTGTGLAVNGGKYSFIPGTVSPEGPYVEVGEDSSSVYLAPCPSGATVFRVPLTALAAADLPGSKHRPLGLPSGLDLLRGAPATTSLPDC